LAEEAWVAVAAETRAVLVVEEKDEAAVLVAASAGEAASAAEDFRELIIGKIQQSPTL
jgi:hypothetical protein